ncbi:MAG: metal-binding protein [Deltaproteobacteria bacterium]|nr:metal-binding protein [Deltaproteobacteria bacterium]
MNEKYFIHESCRFYPCHDYENFRSCLFCWCPLYLLDCGGDYRMTHGVKDCSGCFLPHAEEGYDYILQQVNQQIYHKSGS